MSTNICRVIKDIKVSNVKFIDFFGRSCICAKVGVARGLNQDSDSDTDSRWDAMGSNLLMRGDGEGCMVITLHANSSDIHDQKKRKEFQEHM